MWTILPKVELDNFLQTHPKLQRHDGGYFLHDDGEYIFLPRHFVTSYPFDRYIVHIDEAFKAETIDIEFTGELRPEQKPAVNTFINEYQTHNFTSGILQARPGFGKTVSGAYLTCTLKQKTLIILDNSKLLEQWVDAYKTFTTLTEDDIGIIQGKKFESDKPVAIAMVQTLLSKVKRDLKEFYIKMKDAGYGLVLYDEVHKTSSAPKFASSTLLLNTRNIIGLSATPFAIDLNQILLYNTIGEIKYFSKDYELVPKVYYINYDSELGAKYGRRMNMSFDYIKKISFYNSVIHKSTKYLSIIYDLVLKLKEKEHRTIVIVSTIKQVEAVIDYLGVNGIRAKPFYSKEKDIDKVNDKIIVATYKMAGTGFDYKELSALILACPLKGKVSLIQTIGRILRSCEGKRDPVVFDLIDRAFGKTFVSSIPTKTKILTDEFGMKSSFKELYI